MSGETQAKNSSAAEVFLVFLRLGLTSFGGPVAHLGYFRAELVERRRWLGEAAYADLVALCQFLPGPASSQVGMALGFSRAGYAGALAAFTGFTLPSALLMILFALGFARWGESWQAAGALHGLELVAVAVVAQAVYGMARASCTDLPRVAFMVAAAILTLLAPSAEMQIALIAVAGIAGLFLLKTAPAARQENLPIRSSRRAGLFWLSLFILLLAALPVLAAAFPSRGLALADAFYRTGALVFGGGHVVLPLLEAEVVPPGWVSAGSFLAGYGAAQAMPGPLFSFAAFLGAAMDAPPSGWLGGLLCLAAIFAPSFLLVLGALPFWEKLRRLRPMQAALAGIGAAVVGLLLAALALIGRGAVRTPLDLALALAALLALMLFRLPPWLVVVAAAAAGFFAA